MSDYGELRPICMAWALAMSLVQCRYDIVLTEPVDPTGVGTAGSGAVSSGTAGNGGGASGGGASSVAAGNGGLAPTVAAGNGGAAPTVTAGNGGATSSGGGSPTALTPVVAFAPGTSWQWQSTGELDPSVSAAIFVVDLNEPAIASLTQAARMIVCNFSAGTREGFRTDVAGLPAAVIGNDVAGQADEAWLDVRSTTVRALMSKRLELAVARGCHAVLPDSIDGYGANTGFSLTKADSTEYLSFLSREAHARGLGIGLSNASELAAAVEPWFDFVVEVNCLDYDECDRYATFLTANKAVLHAELVRDAASGAEQLSGICSDPRRQGFSSIVKTTQLDAWRLGCE